MIEVYISIEQPFKLITYIISIYNTEVKDMWFKTEEDKNFIYRENCSKLSKHEKLVKDLLIYED